jgi:NADPH-dependent 2,4-dienoyl-CoA reductase/sulfur reductase-like enzyme
LNPFRAMPDLAVIGAGPAGIAAAVAAEEAGRSVLLIDESPRPGGQIWRHLQGTPPTAARSWLRRLDRCGAEVRAGTAVVDAVAVAGAARRFELTLQGEDGAEAFEAAAVVLATGARERFLPFPGWTLPNVVGVGGAQALLKAGACFAGRRVVVAGSGPLLLPVSAALTRAGARLLLVAEQAPLVRTARFAAGLWRHPGRLAQAATYRAAALRAPYRAGSWVTGARGDGRVEEVEVTDGAATRTLACDLLCTGFGLVPNLELARLLGCAVERGAVRVDDRQRTSVDGVWCAGEGTGVAGVEAALAEGWIAGCGAAGRADAAAPQRRVRDREREFAARLETAFAPREELRRLADDDTILCRCEDVRCGAVRPGWTARQARLYARVGMGPCQGRVCGPAAGFLFGWDFEGGRPPATVATIDTLARTGDS